MPTTDRLLLDATPFQRLDRRVEAYRCRLGTRGTLTVYRGTGAPVAALVWHINGWAILHEFSEADAATLWRIARLQQRGMMPRAVA